LHSLRQAACKARSWTPIAKSSWPAHCFTLHCDAIALANWLFSCTASHAGVTTEEQLLSPDNSIHPDVYMDSLAAMLEVKQPVSA